MDLKKLLALCALAALHLCGRCRGATVHFTNSNARLERSYDDPDSSTRTYQLDVPGSGPITIIERDAASGANERRTKDYVVPGSTHERVSGSRCYGPSCTDKKTVYSPDLLNKFLKEYAEKIKNADQTTKDRLQRLEIVSTDDGDEDDREKSKITEKVDVKLQPTDDVVDGKKLWQDKRPYNKRPYDDDRDGWVTLEAIPWTKSKISKWQANVHKVKPGYDSQSYHDRFSVNNFDHGNSQDDYDGGHHYSKPSYYDRPDDESVPSRPPWAASKPLSKPHQHHQHRPDCDHNGDAHENNNYDDGNNRRVYYHYENGGIITDGRPSDFPSHQYQSGRFKETLFQGPTEVTYADRPRKEYPASHPLNGDGEWVLVSTTKGYQAPRKTAHDNKKRQRSLGEVAGFARTVTARASTRLTVLPAVNGSRENMTTSHGGMLEVEPSFRTVEESRRRDLLAKRLKGLVASTTDASPDGSAVVAAVGAGLVPATVAMFMPMVLGRKKRALLLHRGEENGRMGQQIVTQLPHLAYESTLQRSLK